IRPIWFILPMGLPIAAGGGLAVGWAYAELLPGLPPRPWAVLALIGVIVACLIPAAILAELRPPLVTGTSENDQLTVSTGRAVAIFVSQLLLTAAAVGALAGWWIGGSGRAALATSLAGLVFALGPGHNIPFLGNSQASGKGIVLLLSVVLVSAVVLVEAHFALSGGRAASGS
ncbi:MAG: hypothetical protein ACRDHG_04505, partial [Anaerolineales bacterium]